MKIVKWARKKSPWIFHVCTGGCNGCDIELIAALTPKYDVERLGIKLVGSPRHADILIVTGILNKRTFKKFLRVYEQVPEPKKVIALGSCACNHGPFQNSYNTEGKLKEKIKVDMFIPGCPPRPQAIIDGIKKLLEVER